MILLLLSKNSFKYHILKIKFFKIELENKIIGYILWLEKKNILDYIP